MRIEDIHSYKYFPEKGRLLKLLGDCHDNGTTLEQLINALIKYRDTPKFK